MNNEFELDITDSLQENINRLYQKRKKLKEKNKRLEKIIVDTKQKLEEARKKQEHKEKNKQDKVQRAKRKPKWYEKFHWFYTGKGKLAVGGRSAQQNDILYSKYFEDNDLFFHAEIQGASAVILKDGASATENELKECAQFAACYSKAWTSNASSIDVYCMRKEQVSKHARQGFVGKGGFALKGKRTWFRSVELKLTLYAKKIENVNVLHVMPGTSKNTGIKKSFIIIPGKKKKGALSKIISENLNVDSDEVIRALPGASEFKKSK